MLSVAVDRALEKNIQGSRPAKRNNGKGMPKLVMRRMVEKTKVRTTICMNGLTKIPALPENGERRQEVAGPERAGDGVSSGYRQGLIHGLLRVSNFSMLSTRDRHLANDSTSQAG